MGDCSSPVIGSGWQTKLSKTSVTSIEAILAAHSRVLAEEVRQHPHWLKQLMETDLLQREMTRDDYIQELLQTPFQVLEAARFRRKCLLRILLRDVMGYATLAGTTAEISALADALLHWSYRQLRMEAVKLYGEPRTLSGAAAELSILAVGKLGGYELNYSSDIDLMYIYTGAGETDGSVSAEPLNNKEFFEKLAQRHSRFLGVYTEEGICYRVDLRLRPDGSMGELALSLDAAKDYYQHRARDWELQMMIKARVTAGEEGPGNALIDFVEPLSYGTTTDFSAIEAVSAARVRINEKLSSRTLRAGSVDVKLTRGGIRDIEFLVQCLQRLHGGREPWVRHGGTLVALGRLHDKGLISGGEFHALTGSYEFLRTLEHRLQMMEDRQTHTLPESADEIEDLAQRVPPLSLGFDNRGPRLIEALKEHLRAVEIIYDKVVYGRPLVRWENAGQMDGRGGVRRNGAQLDRLMEKAGPWIDELNADPVLAGRLFDVVDHSLYLCDELARHPDWIRELQLLGGVPASFPLLASAGELRREYRRRLFQIECESLCLRRPIFDTLGAHSDLADEAIGHAYRFALQEIGKSAAVEANLRIIALGRLGLREFDLASDADLIFVLPDEAREELEFWTRVAARTIEILTSYTGDGVIFTVDTRLRPYGREGDLVQTEQAYKDYFAHHAEAWEGIAYLKARAVAGGTDAATRFLNEVQQIDWRRHGQSQRSRPQLRDMRQRLERELGKTNPLKAGPGGYFDIDFSLMYLRLRSAGMFFKVLNTPERIDVIEQMGHLEREDASFLREAATLYRAVDHGMRLYTGQAAAMLPEATAAMEPVAEMVQRWMPQVANEESLENYFRRIQAKARATFDHLFGQSAVAG
jgi:[glutamine synthetase] adenylyltransferase / [glutamine synthetase]-adenylyl-L-tyrosine phosphorylase